MTWATAATPDGLRTDDEAVRSALDEANLPTLLVALAQLTGDDRWLRDPYRPTPARGPGDHDSGGFSETLQATLRDEAFEIVTAWRDRRLEPAPAPSPDKIEEMLSISLGSVELPDGCGPLLAEELGVVDRDVSLPATPAADDFCVAVIGAGFSGLLAAIKLKQAGIAHTVIEKNDTVGGTWCENRYPGCGVDTPTHLYSLSFAQNPDWSRYFAKRDELHAYLERLADDHGVRPRIRFGSEVLAAEWDDADQRWRLDVRDREGQIRTISANAVISGVGFLNRPAFPRIPTIDRFGGPVFHTARWRDDVDLRGKRVAVIGTGASAMQAVPNLADVAGRLIVFQRTPQWAIPHPNYLREVSPATKVLMREVPFYLGWYRLRQVWNFGDRLHQHVQWDPDWPHPEHSINDINERQRRFLTEYMKAELGDRVDELLPKCLPSYPPYGKRPLLDNGWFRAVTRDNVDLVTDNITEIRADRIVTSGGEFPADVIVVATGFQALRVLHPMKVRGRSGRTLREIWGEDDARAYLGITIPECPNFFCLLGPNTFAGHGGSGVLSIELELRYTMEMLAKIIALDLASVEVRQDVHDTYNTALDEALSRTIWAHPGMTTYYRNSKGRIVVPMPWTNVAYWHMTREPNLDEYHCVRRAWPYARAA